jgi:hypothetical protein
VTIKVNIHESRVKMAEKHDKNAMTNKSSSYLKEKTRMGTQKQN